MWEKCDHMKQVMLLLLLLLFYAFLLCVACCANFSATAHLSIPFKLMFYYLFDRWLEKNRLKMVDDEVITNEPFKGCLLLAAYSMMTLKTI